MTVYKQKYRPNVVIPTVDFLLVTSKETENTELLTQLKDTHEKVLQEACNFQIAHAAQSSELLRIDSSHHSNVNLEEKTGWMWLFEDRKIEKTPDWFGAVLPNIFKRYRCGVEGNNFYKEEFINGENIRTSLASLVEITMITKLTQSKRKWCIELSKTDGSHLLCQAESQDDLDHWVNILADVQEEDSTPDQRKVSTSAEPTQTNKMGNMLNSFKAKTENTFKSGFDKLKETLEQPNPGNAKSYDLTLLGKSEPFQITPDQLESITGLEELAKNLVTSTVRQPISTVAMVDDQKIDFIGWKKILFKNLIYAWDGSDQGHPKTCMLIFNMGGFGSIIGKTQFCGALVEYSECLDFFKELQSARMKEQSKRDLERN